MKKILFCFVLFCSVLFCRNASASHPLESICSITLHNHNYWVNKVDSVFVGKILGLKLKTHEYHFSTCELTVFVSKWLKGQKVDMISTKVGFASSEKQVKINACSDFEKNKNYIFFGFSRKIGVYGEPITPFIYTGKNDRSIKEKKYFSCPPVLPLDGNEDFLLEIEKLPKKKGR